jgi:hypothetical protein
VGFVYLFEFFEFFCPPAMPDDPICNQFEKASEVLLELCDEAVDLAERKHRLGVRKELNKLYRLYDKLESQEIAGDESETLAAIRAHLEPLGLTPEGTPLPELARLAALRITEK